MEGTTSTARVALKYGLLASIVVIIYGTVINIAGQAENKWLSSIGFIFLIVAIVMAIKDFRTQNGGYVSYGEGLGLGTLVGAIIGLLSSLFSMFYIQFIDNSVITKSMERAREDLESRGMDDAQIEQTMELSQKLVSPGVMFIIGVLLYLIIGFVLSLIIAAILRREKPVFE